MGKAEILTYEPGEEVVIGAGAPLQLRLNNGKMNGEVSKEVIDLYSNITFYSIFVGYKKMYLGSILENLSENFLAPKELDLDLFYGIEKDGVIRSLGNLSHNESETREIFSRWEGSGCKVIFRCNELVMRSFNL